MIIQLPDFIPHDSAIDILDSTKVKTYSLCPRKFFYSNVLGWKPEADNHDLIVGIGWHLAMEHLFANIGNYGGVVTDAVDVFLNFYRQHYGEETDTAYAPKDPANVCLGILTYAAKFTDDRFKTHYTEVAGVVPVTEEYNMHFKIDAVCEGPVETGGGDVGIFIVDHKTTTMDTKVFREGHGLSIQFGTYIHAANMYYERIYGLIVNGAIFRKQPTSKSPKAKGNDFVRIPVVRTDDQMADWQYDVECLFRKMEWDFKRLMECKESDQIMPAFGKNREACVQYNKLCPFHAFCNAWQNPLRHIDRVPVGFKIEHWDPRNLEREAKYVLRDGKMVEGEHKKPEVEVVKGPEVIEEEFFNA